VSKRPRPPDSLSIELTDGRVLELARRDRPGQEVSIRVVGAIGERYFNVCPICGDRATHKEDVPPRSIGGRVMTRTCQPCNNGLGSKVEADLVDWYDTAVTLPAFSGDAVQGARRPGRIFFRVTSDGKPVLLMDESTDPGVRELLLSDNVDLTANEPDHNRVRLALLKHAFLAACLVFGPLEGPDADAVRADLIAARDAPSRQQVPRSAIALGLTVLRGEPRVKWPPLVYCIADMEDGAEIHGVTLAGRTFVSWSSEPVADAEVPQKPVRVSFAIGAPIDGVVSEVDS
jgi:hypothetical protein